jgi:hypothetical protein
VNELNAIILNRRRLNTLAVGRKAARSAPQTQWTDQGTRGPPDGLDQSWLADAKPTQWVSLIVAEFPGWKMHGFLHILRECPNT